MIPGKHFCWLSLPHALCSNFHYSSSEAAGWDGGYICHHIIVHRVFSNPLAAGRCAEGTLQSFSCSKMPPWRWKWKRAGKAWKRVHDCVLPRVNLQQEMERNLGSVHLHHLLLCFHLNGAVPPFKSQGLQDNQCILRSSGWGSSGQVQNSNLQIPGEPGRDFLEIDTFRVKRPWNRFFHHFGL